MKNLKKLSREALKNVMGSGSVSNPIVYPDGSIGCNRGAQLCDIGCEPKCVSGPCYISGCIN